MVTILTFIDYYLPGFKAGGALRSIANLTETLGDEFHFRIVTRDRDLGDRTPYPSASRGGWQRVGRADVLYLAEASAGPVRVRAIVRDTPHDAVYLNSIFSRRFSMLVLVLRSMGLVPRRPLVLAPRGELHPGALAIKPKRKRAFLAVARRARLFDNVIWQASTEMERADMIVALQEAGLANRVILAPDIATAARGDAARGESERRPKAPGSVRMVFLSRITPKKNLDGALELLSHVRGDVGLDIYGPREEVYWQRCEALIRRLPRNVCVQYRGELPHDAVSTTLSQYDLFLLPTHGENYGHVIVEALAAGCPVLISDQTAFRGLQAEGAGWDLPLDEPAQFLGAIERMVKMDRDEHDAMVAAARQFARQALRDGQAADRNAELFRLALRSDRSWGGN